MKSYEFFVTMLCYHFIYNNNNIYFFLKKYIETFIRIEVQGKCMDVASYLGTSITSVLWS